MGEKCHSIANLTTTTKPNQNNSAPRPDVIVNFAPDKIKSVKIRTIADRNDCKEDDGNSSKGQRAEDGDRAGPVANVQTPGRHQLGDKEQKVHQEGRWDRLQQRLLPQDQLS